MVKFDGISYIGGQYAPSAASSATSGWVQSSWFTVDSAQAANSALVLPSPIPAYYTDTRNTHHPGLNAGNAWVSKVTTASASGDNRVVGPCSPRNAALGQLGFVAGIFKTVRHFISLDQLFKASVRSSLNSSLSTAYTTGTILEPEAVLNVIDFLHICNMYGMKVFLVLYNIDTSSSHTHGFYAPSTVNFGGTQTTNQAALSQTYLTALSDFLTFIDAYPIARSVIAGIDLHNEAYYQLTSNGSSDADAKEWINVLLKTAKGASSNFKYTVSEACTLSDLPTNLRAATLSNRQAARDIYALVDYLDPHIYRRFPDQDAQLLASLDVCANFNVPWIAGECADDATGTGSVFDGQAAIQAWTQGWYYKNLWRWGCSAVITPGIGIMLTYSSNTGTPPVPVYTDGGGMALIRKLARAEATS